VLAGAACISLLSQARAVSTDMGALAGIIQAQQEAPIISDPSLATANNKETLYVSHIVKKVEKVDPYWILTVGND